VELGDGVEVGASISGHGITAQPGGPTEVLPAMRRHPVLVDIIFRKSLVIMVRGSNITGPHQIPTD
jgi:hypothetical protein